MDAASRPAASEQTTSAPAARALSADQLRRHRLARKRGNIDDTQARTAHVQSLQARRARDQEIERANAPPGGDDGGSAGDIAAGAANALPRDRFRQHLNHRTCPIDGIGIDHAIATLRHRLAGLDPDRRRGKRQRRIGRGADEIAGAQGPAIGGGDIARRKRAAAAAYRRRRSPARPRAEARPARPARGGAATRRAPRRAE